MCKRKINHRGFFHHITVCCSSLGLCLRPFFLFPFCPLSLNNRIYLMLSNTINILITPKLLPSFHNFLLSTWPIYPAATLSLLYSHFRCKSKIKLMIFPLFSHPSLFLLQFAIVSCEGIFPSSICLDYLEIDFAITFSSPLASIYSLGF